MTTIEIKKTLSQEFDNLPADVLQEVLDFVEYLKIRRLKSGLKSSSSNQALFKDLNALESDSLMHLEEEFADYKESYPHE